MWVRKALQTGILAATSLLALAASPARADGLKCTMAFTMKGWSAFYQTAEGRGTIHCSNGRSMQVKLSAKGGGVTVGKSVESGHGEFSNVDSMSDLLGSYASAQAHAGAINSAQVQVMTKGEVSLALSGKGHGWELGISFGELKIER
ncbi:MAG TPA: hypothetical protein VMD49_03865 [Steroidobacteraceae bacterium]|jgi:hypothetical protein|nr:hypothetical protein [Steroidobacteraceae bacterium]